MAAALIGSRAGIADAEARLLLASRLGQLFAQALALAPLCLLGVGISDLEGRLATVAFSGGLSLFLFCTTAAATRFARGRGVALGPLFAVAILIMPLLRERFGGMAGWEHALLARWQSILVVSTLVAAWPRRSVPERAYVARPAVAILALGMVADLVVGTVVSGHWSAYKYSVGPAAAGDDVAWARHSTFGGYGTTGGTTTRGVLGDLPQNSFPYAGPGGSALFISLGWKAAGNVPESVPAPNTFLFVDGRSKLACETNSSSEPNWRPDGKAAAVGYDPVTLMDSGHGCTERPGVKSMAWLGEETVELTASEITTSGGKRWPLVDASYPRLVQAGSRVYLSGESGIWLVTGDGPRRLGDRPQFGGEKIFADGVCFGVPVSGYRCWRGEEALPPMGEGPEAVAVDESYRWASDRTRTLVNSVTGARRVLPDPGAYVSAVRARGRTIDLFGPDAWWSWEEGQKLRRRSYMP